jgi:hypothetical protein
MVAPAGLPGLKSQSAAFAIDPGSTTDGAKNDHRR